MKIIAEALLRIEHKLDMLLANLKAPAFWPMSFKGLPCPVCQQPVQYMLDLTENVAKRRCGCSSGIIPSEFPIVPGVGNGEAPANRSNESEDDHNGAQDRSKR